MNRRDTIIIAVLVNAGLLMVLFATALKSDDKEGKAMPLVEKTQQPLIDTNIAAQYTMAAVPTLGAINEEIVLEDLKVHEEKAVEVAVQQPAAAKAVESTPFVNVTVKKGDFLEKIAKANNTSISAIMKENHLASSQLKVGQVLKIPLSQKPSTAEKPSVAATVAEEYYVVKEGDNPWTIATKNQISLNELLRINNLDEQKARRLRPGDRLKIR